jgi:hypothetical protein
MIHETATCDICGTDKKEANNWFMALEEKGTVKLSAWGGLKRGRSVIKHLCGQSCVHRFVDDFLARHSGEALPDASIPPTHLQHGTAPQPHPSRPLEKGLPFATRPRPVNRPHLAGSFGLKPKRSQQ